MEGFRLARAATLVVASRLCYAAEEILIKSYASNHPLDAALDEISFVTGTPRSPQRYKFTNVRWNSIAIESLLRGNISSLPSELIQGISKSVSKNISLAALPVLVSLSLRLSHFNLKGSYPLSLVLACVRRLPRGISKAKFRLNDLTINDDFLEVLASSGAAATLQELDLDETSLSIRSAPHWSTFTAIESIDFGSSLGTDAICAILAVLSPTLRRLNLRSDAPVSPSVVLQVLIARRLKLSHLSLDSGAGEGLPAHLEELKEILRTNPEFSSALEEFTVSNTTSSTFFNLDSLLRESPPSLSAPNPQLQQIALPLRNPPLSRYLPETEQPDTGVMTPEILIRIAQRFPTMQTFHLTIHTWAAPDLSVLSCVRSLRLALQDMESIPTAWPPSVRLLSLQISNKQAAVPVDAFLRSVSTHLPELTSLTLQSGGTASLASIERLLAALPKLRSLHLAITTEPGTVRICHPRLRSVPFFGNIETQVQVGCMPRLKFGDLLSTPGQTPEIDTMKCYRSELDLDLDALLRLPTVQTLVVIDDSRRAMRPRSAPVPIVIKQLANVRKLELQGFNSGGDFWHDFFRGNPRLVSLEISDGIFNAKHGPAASTLQDFSFLENGSSMPFLASLALSNLGSLIPNTLLSPFRLDGIHFPNLMQVHVGVAPLSSIKEISLRGLPNLYRFSVRGEAAGDPACATNLSVVDCPLVDSIECHGLCISSLILCNLKALTFVSVEGSRFFRSSSDQRIEAERIFNISGVPLLDEGPITETHADTFQLFARSR